MRPPGHRAKKYEAKVRGLVIPGQRERFKGAAGGQLEAERYIKTLGLPTIYQNYYMIFAKQILRIASRHSGNIAQSEVCIAFDRWLGRGLDTTQLTNIVEHYNFQPCVEPAPPACAWDYKMKLTFTGNVSAANLDDFPVLIHLTAANFDFTHAQANGEDIRFMDSDTCPTDGTPLKHEIEDWDSVGLEAWVWVKVPRIDGGSVVDFIYMFFDNPGVGDGQDPVNVWDVNHVMVQHMYDVAGNITDSTSNNNDGTKRAAGEPLEVAGSMYMGQDFDGTNDYITVPHSVSLNISGNITISAWVHPTSGSGFRTIMGKWNHVGGPNYGSWKLAYNYTLNRLLLTITSDGTDNNNCYAAALNLEDGSWHLVTVSYDGTNMRILVDGNLLLACPYALGINLDAAVDLIIGARRAGAAYGEVWLGEIDEIRISNKYRDADWAMASFRSGTDILITYGAEEPS